MAVVREVSNRHFSTPPSSMHLLGGSPGKCSYRAAQLNCNHGDAAAQPQHRMPVTDTPPG